MTGIQKQKIQELIGEVRAAVSKAESKLEAALQERENIISLPVTKQQIKNDFAYAVDTSAARFEETFNSVIAGRSRKRDATGISKSPDMIRKIGNYSELNIDAINYFFGDIIKNLTNKKIDEVEYFGRDDGVDNLEFNELLEAAEIKVDKLKLEHDEVVAELQTILG